MGITLRYPLDMRVLVISDIHANLTALEAVLESAGTVDQTWCLGDVVGYGPDPNECVSKLRGLPNLICILGNHDAAVTGRIPQESFNPEARRSIQWTRATLAPANLTWLSLLPEKTILSTVTLAHGSPRNPVWEYLLDPNTAQLNFGHFSTPLCFVGHTHLPIIYFFNEGQRAARWMIPPPGHDFKPTGKAILNPGSVGQPRDRDSRAAFAIYDTIHETWTPRRIAYSIKSVQQRILSASLPERHAIRLAEGW
jgi:predicted phosphodiesterase